MATRGGVTQAIFPEGGLSVTGALQPPKVGLLSYVLEAYAADPARDIAFVPVAINYDRVLEDNVLIAAGKRGDRRFGARISVVVWAFFRKFWQRVRGKDTRFGSAAVAFGSPVSLIESGLTDAETLSTALMERISEVMPVLAVPLMSHVFLRTPRIEVSDLVEKVRELMAHAPVQNRAIHEDELDAEVQRGLTGLRRRGILRLDQGHWVVENKHEDVLIFYARSIAHLLPKDTAIAKKLAAHAKS